ncbi:MAG: thiamine pyrophosphate-binding protein [Deltaproteobacteria bacterium]|nr:thiamine pyrophosphate-binding protein [Deltaproteobacteria bacterium]
MNKKSGAWLVRYALEQLPVSHTFGIPGVHNTEIYDELNKSEKIKPVLVTHEGGASFIADAISRTSPGEIGTLVIVPAAGITHAMSGVGEAFLDGIPMLVISGGTRSDVEFGYQLHELDQVKLLSGITKGAWRVKEHKDIVPTIFEAYRIATSGTPGPVFVEIPANLQLFQGPVDGVPAFHAPTPTMVSPETTLDQAVELLLAAKSPGLFVGWGAVDVSDELVKIADLLGAPVSTTLQGLSAFPGNHPLFTGMGFSRAAVPAAENAFKGCDCLLAIGTRFGEIPTGSFGCEVPANLIHMDVNKEVFHRNFPAKVAVEGDSRVTVPKLLRKLEARGCNTPERAARRARVAEQVARDRRAYRDEWFAHDTKGKVNPARFFEELRRQLADDALCVVDDGNHTFLAAELFEVRRPRGFVSPTDFNCMGYAVPAAIGAKLVNPTKQVVGIVGDGAFMMTGLEILTAATLNAGIAYFVFYDGELSQISQGQEIPYNRKTCTIVGQLKLEGVALATGAKYIAIENDVQLKDRICDALAAATRGQPVIVDVRVDYSKRTRFTQGVVKTVLKRFPLGDKFRFIGRAVVRKVTG